MGDVAVWLAVWLAGGVAAAAACLAVARRLVDPDGAKQLVDRARRDGIVAAARRWWTP